MERQIAARYAEALFSLAQEKGKIDRIEAELRAFLRLLEEVPDLLRMLDHPEVSLERKFKLLDKALAGAVLPITHAFLELLVRRGRSHLSNLVTDEYRLFADEAKGLARVKVTSAVALTEKEKERMQGALQRLTGKTVVMESFVDPALLAGVRAEIGHRLLDGSAAGRLEEMREKIKGMGGMA